MTVSSAASRIANRVPVRFAVPLLVSVVVGTIAMPSLPASASPAGGAHAVAASAPRAVTHELTLASGAASVQAKGGTWSVVVGFTGNIGGNTKGTLELGVTRIVDVGGVYGGEIHDWKLPVTMHDVTFTPPKGSSTKAELVINSATALSPVASVDITLKATSSGSASSGCGTGSYTTYSGDMSGTVQITTGLESVSIGGSGLSFGSSTLIDNALCGTAPVPCATDVWTGPGVGIAGQTGALGGSLSIDGESVDVTTVEKVTKLKTPSGAQRIDGAAVEANKPKSSGGTLTITSSSSGIVTGSGSLSAGTATTATNSCVSSGQNYTETTTEYAGATFGSTKAFTACPSTSDGCLSSKISAPTSGSGSYEMVTLKGSGRG